MNSREKANYIWNIVREYLLMGIYSIWLIEADNIKLISKPYFISDVLCLCYDRNIFHYHITVKYLNCSYGFN